MRTATLGLIALLLLAALPAAHTKAEERTNNVNVKKITPLLFVEEVEPCVKFWVERMGFQKIAEVPEGDKLGFAMLQKGNVELMYQSYASADKDVSTISQVVRKGPAFIYVEVDSLDQTIAAIQGAEIVMPVRKTFYGSTEIGIKDPGGHFITFAEFAPSPNQ